MHLQKQWWCLNNPHHTCCVERLNHSMFHEKRSFLVYLFIYILQQEEKMMINLSYLNLKDDLAKGI